MNLVLSLFGLKEILRGADLNNKLSELTGKIGNVSPLNSFPPQVQSINPRDRAVAIAWALFFAPSFRMAFWRWNTMVRSLILRVWDVSHAVRPSFFQDRTSFSRAESKTPLKEGAEKSPEIAA